MRRRFDPLSILWNDYSEAVTEFRAKKCRDYCPVCGDNCCNGRLNPAIGSRAPFKNLKVVRYRWDKPPENDPYIVDRRFLWMGACYLVRTCPCLREGQCGIYDKPERPWECTDYPLYLQAPLNIPFLRPIICAERSCCIFKYEKNCRELESLAESLKLEVIFHPPPEEQ